MSQKLSDTTHIFSGNFIFIEELYQKFLADPNSVDESWREYFKNNSDSLNTVNKDAQGASWSKSKLKVIGSEDFDISSVSKKEAPKKDIKTVESVLSKDLDIRVHNLITAYRRFGHMAANLDPLGLTPRVLSEQINPETHGILASDLEKEVDLKGEVGFGKVKISALISRLNQIYVGNIGAEFEYISDAQQKAFLAKETENAQLSGISSEEKIKVLKEIVRTEGFEQFLHKRFPGAKRFSVEGGDTSINALEKIIDASAKSGVKKIVIGMAHRGRLNTLTGVMGKPYHQMISEFQGTPGIPEDLTESGDVKYHMGYASQREIAGNKIDLSLAFNPSHLEAVNSVVAGRVRAKQDIYGDIKRTSAMAVLIHGDAAFAGQGSVMENLMMNGIKGYNTGGVMHIIVNNQVGFTASAADERSTPYASDMAKAIEAPIFHVNGDDPEAVIKVADIATKFRMAFKKDVVIDLICYRRYGHNEGDEPMYTQPVMYNKIKDHPTIEKIYSEKLISEGVISEDSYKKIHDDFYALLSGEFDKAQKYQPKDGDWLKGDWSKIVNGDKSNPKTAVTAKKLKDLMVKLVEIPSGFNANPKVVKQFEARKNAVETGKDIDWGNAETLAYATLLDEGYPVRLTGQDCGRGTFSHRHSVLHDMNDDSRYIPLNNLGEKAAKYEVHDSFLSEFAVLGFEYGYSLSRPYALTLWEAQFGDFANNTQVIIDQFIASSEVKWLRKSGLVMLLPHGYEGQGPEHSSARLERYLQLCGNDNMRVVNITNPANFFHALRRQIHSKDRKPLVVMSPKSLLRHKLAVSNIEEFCGDNKFRLIIGETEKLVSDEKIKRVVLCSGRVYYDLLEARTAGKINDIALIRLEQLYPFPKEELQIELARYKNAEIIWCQEEPKNMGSWQFVSEILEEVLTKIKAKYLRAKYVGRVASASPATGYGKYYTKEQKALIEEALK